MGTSCTKLQHKKTPKQHPSPPPFSIDTDQGPGTYEPRAVAEISGEVRIRIIEPSEPSVHEEVEDEAQEEVEEEVKEEEKSIRVNTENPPVEGTITPVYLSVGESRTATEGAGRPRTSAEGGDEEVKSEANSIHSKSSQRSQRSQKKGSMFSFLTKKDPDKSLEMKGAKTAAHPSRNKTIDDFATARDDKDFPTDGLEKFKVLTRDHLPLDILTRRTKILNNLKSKMSALEKLELRHCKLNTFPTEFKSKAIKELNFNDNIISELPQGAFHSLPELVVLDVSQNRIVSIPDSLSECGKLRELYLSRNLITGFDPNTLTSLTNLTTIDLMHNRIETLTFSLQSIPMVRELNLSMNLLRSVEDAFFEGGGECRMEVLKLSLNPMMEISVGVMQLVCLRRLDLRQTHIGCDNPVVVRIQERNREQTEVVVKCLINQLVLYTEPKRPEMSSDAPMLRAPFSNQPEKAQEQLRSQATTSDVSRSKPRESVVAMEEMHAAQNQVVVKEEDYDLPPKLSPLHNPLRELILQVGDNLHMFLTITTIEKIVKQGIESRERGTVVVDLPLTSNYFMERIAKYPSAINVLAAFKYQIKDDPRRGLVLQPTSDFNCPGRSTKRKSRNVPVYRADREITQDTPLSPEDEGENVKKLLAALMSFRVSVNKVVEKEFNVPDFKAYHRGAA